MFNYSYVILHQSYILNWEIEPKINFTAGDKELVKNPNNAVSRIRNICFTFYFYPKTQWTYAQAFLKFHFCAQTKTSRTQHAREINIL